MRKSSNSPRASIICEPKNFLKFPGKCPPQFNPNFEVKDQFEPTDAHPIRRRHAEGGARDGTTGTAK